MLNHARMALNAEIMSVSLKMAAHEIISKPMKVVFNLAIVQGFKIVVIFSQLYMTLNFVQLTPKDSGGVLHFNAKLVLKVLLELELENAVVNLKDVN